MPVTTLSTRGWHAVLVCVLALAVLGAGIGPLTPTASAQSGDEASVTVSNVTASTQTPSVGEPFSLEVTISNFETSPQAAVINELVVRADGERKYIADDLGRLSPGAQTTVTVPLSFDEPGQKDIRLSIYGESRGRPINAGAPFAVTVRDSQQPSLSVSVPEAVTGASRDVNVTVANGIGHPVENVVVTAESSSGNVTFEETKRVSGQMEAGETRTFSFPARVTTAGRYPVNVSLSYTDEGTRRQISERFDARFGEPSNIGRVILAGVEATQRGGTLELSATASNVGSSEVGGVVVSVAGSDAVRGQTYFVGSIEGSGFSTFTMRTSTSDRLTSIPVEVTYVTGGVERSTVTEVQVDSPPTPTPTSGGGGNSLLSVPMILGGVAVLMIIGVGVLYRRRG